MATELGTDIRKISFVLLSSLLLFGTIYSVASHTYLDTSDPAIALTHAPHPLHNTNYFARKNNALNTIFIKRAWAWTSGAALLLYLTAPSPVVNNPGTRQTTMSSRERILKWASATFVWLAFTSWFFGPGLLSRLTVASGGECVVRLPSGYIHTIPLPYCFPSSPEDVYLSPSTHPQVFYQTPLAPDAVLCEGDWRTRARLMRGHDVSGHIFLLTMSLLFLADSVRPHLANSRPRSLLQSAALGATLLLMAVWFLSILTTAVYFHTPSEKFSGYLIGLAGYLFTQLPFFRKQELRSSISHIHNE